MRTKIFLFVVATFLTIHVFCQTVTDIDGNVYNKVIIGTQVWLGSNLKTITFNDGSPIPNVTVDSVWINLTTPAYSYYNNDSTTFNATYGGLYNWYAVTTYKICPTGWHVPTDADWVTLIGYLGGESVAGTKLREAGTSHWMSPNYATNESEFTALPGGFREFAGGEFVGINYEADFWTSTIAYPTTAWGYNILYFTATVYRVSHSWTNGLSIRCVCDTLTSNINDYELIKEIDIYPNPAVDKITIDAVGKQNQNFYIYSIDGKLILQGVLYNNKQELDISTLKKGMYIIIFSCNDRTLQKKIIKE
ncbi:MAG: FISUMP domain-containing protein [Bacteroidales bacterium]|jgi:uncharacterized protein (TIGR02145 family)|nr:T9SS type A sorting domain-containing protein [Bacteroidales bacterium]MDD4214025.1 FISUMP domain-containing protein [Bacteroidales bacterium]